MGSRGASSSPSPATTAGYSGTPLAKKLTLAPGTRIWFHAMPDSVRAAIDPAAIGLIEIDAPEQDLDGAHLFVTDRAELERLIGKLRRLLRPAGRIWGSWPKKASKVPTDVTEDVIRDVALPTGLVDIKVCAVDATWSGLKLVIRRELRE